MGLLHRVFGSFGPSQDVSSPYHWIAEREGGRRTHSGLWVNEAQAMKLSAVTACVQILSRLLAQLPIAVHERTGPGKSEIARDHPLDWIISQDPNEWMSSYIWRETLQQHAVLWGNGYSQIVRDGFGRPRELWPLLPDRTFPRIKPENGRLEYETHTRTGQPLTLPWEDVLHVAGLGFDGLVGYSVIANARQSFGLGLAAEEFGSRFFGSGAKSGGFLQYPGKVGDKRQQNIEASFQKEHAGLEHAHEVRVLEEGMKWVPTTIPPDDAQFLQTRQFQVEDAARWFGVPLFMIQAHSKDTSWGSGVEQQMIGFLVVHQDSWFKRWEQEMERKLLSPEERRRFFIKFNVEGLLRADSKSKAEFLRTLVHGSMMKPNEARAKLDLPPDENENGDRLLLAKNIGFLDDPQDAAGTFGERSTDNEPMEDN